MGINHMANFLVYLMVRYLLWQCVKLKDAM